MAGRLWHSFCFKLILLFKVSSSFSLFQLIVCFLQFIPFQSFFFFHSFPQYSCHLILSPGQSHNKYCYLTYFHCSLVSFKSCFILHLTRKSNAHVIFSPFSRSCQRNTVLYRDFLGLMKYVEYCNLCCAILFQLPRGKRRLAKI